MKLDLNINKTSIYFLHCEEQFNRMLKCHLVKKYDSPMKHLANFNANDALNYLRMESESNICRVAQDTIIVISEQAIIYGSDRTIEEINEHLLSNPELKAVVKRRLIGLMDCNKRKAEVLPIFERLSL